MPTVMGPALVAPLTGVTTVNATPTIVASIPIADNSAHTIEVHVTGRRTAGGPETASYVRRFAARREGGAAVIVDIEDGPYTREDNPAWDVQIGASGNNAEVKVVGSGGVTINWAARVFDTIGS